MPTSTLSPLACLHYVDIHDGGAACGASAEVA